VVNPVVTLALTLMSSTTKELLKVNMVMDLSCIGVVVGVDAGTMVNGLLQSHVCYD